MPESDDHQLLREFAQTGSEAAFAILVERYVNLVYSAAVRSTGNPHDAEEITQAVFIILARKGDKLSSRTVLSGWLYQTARLTAANFIKGEGRRQRREQEAYMQSTLEQPQSAHWEELAPLLEEAMGHLHETDRTAIVLHYFERKTAAEVALALRTTEAAVYKRTHRALDKLRNYFAKRGVASTDSGIAEAITANSIQLAPAALAKSVTAVAITKGATASASTLTLIKGALKIMAWTKTKMVIVAGMGVLLAAGTTTVTVKEIENHNDNKWDTGKIDSRILDKAPRIVKIIPSKFKNNSGWAGGNYRMIGIGDTLEEIMQAAYGFGSTRTICLTALSQKRYDFISNVNSSSNDALKEKIKSQFGIVGRIENIETNVLFLRIKQSNAPGLKKTATRDRSSSLQSLEELQFINESSAQIAVYAENKLNIPVMDETGLKGNFDIDLKWKQNGQNENFEQALTDQLGLELVPGTAPVEMLMVEKVK